MSGPAAGSTATSNLRSRVEVALGDASARDEFLNNWNNAVGLFSTTVSATAGELNALHSSGVTATAMANLVTASPNVLNMNYSLGGGTSVDVSTVAASTSTVSIVIPSTITQAAGQTVDAEAMGTFAATNTAKNLNVYFGPLGTVADTQIFNGLAKTNAYSGAHWAQYVTVTFEGTTGAKCNVFSGYSAVTASVTTPQSEETYTRVTGITSGVTQYITFAISGTTSDVVLKMAKAVFKP